MTMHNPAHPGQVVRDACLKPLDLTVTAAAEALGVTRKALSDLLNGHSGVSPDMAIRLEKVFGSSAEAWLRMQSQHDLWRARQRSDSIRVTKGLWRRCRFSDQGFSHGLPRTKME
jgi:addiction module HigA family antidote